MCFVVFGDWLYEKDDIKNVNFLEQSRAVVPVYIMMPVVDWREEQASMSFK